MDVPLTMLRLLAVTLACSGTGIALAAETDANPAAALRAKYVTLQEQAGNNPFQKPLYLESGETTESVSGNIYALVDHPFATAGPALNGPAGWCDILLLHLNTKYCRASTDGRGSTLRGTSAARTNRRWTMPIRWTLLIVSLPRLRAT